MAKIGVNERTKEPTKMECSFIIIDSKPHLTAKGVEYLAKWVKTLYLVTTNKNHPAYSLQEKFDNIVIIYFEEKINLAELLTKLKNEYQVDRLTIQSGGTLNSHWLREKLIDHVSIVIAPCLIGGEKTQSLIGGESLHTQDDLRLIKALKLVKCDVLKESYLHVVYDVLNETQIENNDI